MKSYSEISNKYMKENKKRTILTILGVAMATVLIFAIGTFLFSFRDAMIQEERQRSDFEFRISDLNGEQAKNISNNVEVKDSSIYTVNTENIGSIKGTDRSGLEYKGTTNYYKKIKYEKIVEGEAPQKDNEAVIDIKSKKFLDVEVNDTVTLALPEGEKQFKIVGIIEDGNYRSDAPIGIYTYLDENNLNSVDEYDVYLNIKSEKDKQSIVDKVLKDAGVESIGEKKHGKSKNWS